MFYQPLKWEIFLPNKPKQLKFNYQKLNKACLGTSFVFLASVMGINIKNLISFRIRITVENDSEKKDFRQLVIELGEGQIKEAFSDEQLIGIIKTLKDTFYHKFEREILDTKRSELADKIEDAIIEMFKRPEEFANTKYSYLLAKKLNYSYNYLTSVFADKKGITIEKFIIINKIEKSKELITDGNLSFSEIASYLNYRSISHLSNQFKAITGFTLSQYKKSEVDR